MVRIERWKPEYSRDFARLSREWIERYFAIEPIDIDILDNPKESVIEKGGQLFFVVEDGDVLGTVALLRHSEGEYEISKLGVSPKAQGRGFASALFGEVIEYAKEIRARKLIIESNTILKPALGLYAKFGFERVEDFVPSYKRVNVKFERVLG